MSRFFLPKTNRAKKPRLLSKGANGAVLKLSRPAKIKFAIYEGFKRAELQAVETCAVWTAANGEASSSISAARKKTASKVRPHTDPPHFPARVMVPSAAARERLNRGQIAKKLFPRNPSDGSVSNPLMKSLFQSTAPYFCSSPRLRERGVKVATLQPAHGAAARHVGRSGHGGARANSGPVEFRNSDQETKADADGKCRRQWTQHTWRALDVLSPLKSMTWWVTCGLGSGHRTWNACRVMCPMIRCWRPCPSSYPNSA